MKERLESENELMEAGEAGRAGSDLTQDEAGEPSAEQENPVRIVVHARHADLSQRFRDHVDEKLVRVDRFGVGITSVDVEVSKEHNPRLADRAYEVELTCRGAGPVIRAEAAATDHYAALDIAYGRLEERLRRVAEKRRYHRHGRGSQLSAAEVADIVNGVEQAKGSAAEAIAETAEVDLDDGEGEAVFEQGPVVVREKTHRAAPMSVEQALTEMELVGHDFFLFQDEQTGAPSVVYRRRGYSYGVLRLAPNGQG